MERTTQQMPYQVTPPWLQQNSGIQANPYANTPPFVPQGPPLPAGYSPNGTPPNQQNSLLQFLQSPGGSSLISAGLGGIGAMGQAHAAERMQNQQIANTQQNNAQQLAMQAALANMNNTNTQNAMYMQNAPLGWAQGYEQQQAMKSVILDKLLHYQPPMPTNPNVLDKLKNAGWQPYTPTFPEEWKNANPFGVGQTLEAIAQRQGGLQNVSGGRAPGIDFSKIGGSGDDASRLNNMIGGYQQNAAQYSQNQQNALQDAINMSRNPMAAGKPGTPAGGTGVPDGYVVDEKTGELKKKGSIWGKIGKVAAIGGAGLATAFTGGAASPLLAAAIGMGSGAALGAMNGGGWKGAALGAGMGAIPGGVGLATKGIANPIAKAAIGQGIQMAGSNAINSMGRPGPQGPIINPGGFQQVPGQQMNPYNINPNILNMMNNPYLQKQQVM